MPKPQALAFAVHPNEICYGPVVSLFILLVKKTSRQLIIEPVVVKAVTAFVLFATRGIRAVTVLFVFFHCALHKVHLVMK